MKKLGKMNEAAWLLGNLLCALGVGLCTKANFGLSMFAAPPYILHVFFSAYLPWFSQGISEYLWQGLQLLTLCLIVRKFRVRFLFSFVTALVFGLFIDGWFLLLGGNGAYETIPMRIFSLVAGQLVTTLAIALFFRTDYAPQVPECLVMEVSRKFCWKMETVKQITDLIFLAVSVLLALLLTRSLAGIGVGTVLIALANAPLIGRWGKFLDRFFTFDSAFPKTHAAYLRLTRKPQKA